MAIIFGKLGPPVSDAGGCRGLAMRRQPNLQELLGVLERGLLEAWTSA